MWLAVPCSTISNTTEAERAPNVRFGSKAATRGGASTRTDKRVQHLLQPRMLEIDLKLVALLGHNATIPELAVEHALAKLQVGAPLVA